MRVYFMGYIIYIGTVCKFFETYNIDPVVLQRDNIIYRNTETLERNGYRTLSHLHTHTPILLFVTIVSEKITKKTTFFIHDNIYKIKVFRTTKPTV